MQNECQKWQIYEQLTYSIEELANKNLEVALLAADEQKKDREERKNALMLELDKKQKDWLEQGDNARRDQKHQEKPELKRRLEDLFTEGQKVQRFEAEYTYGNARNEGMAAYFKKEVQQIEEHEQQVQQQLDNLTKKQETTWHHNTMPESSHQRSL